MNILELRQRRVSWKLIRMSSDETVMQTAEGPLVGKVKIKSFASLANLAFTTGEEPNSVSATNEGCLNESVFHGQPSTNVIMPSSPQNSCAADFSQELTTAKLLLPAQSFPGCNSNSSYSPAIEESPPDIKITLEGILSANTTLEVSKPMEGDMMEPIAPEVKYDVPAIEESPPDIKITLEGILSANTTLEVSKPMEGDMMEPIAPEVEYDVPATSNSLQDSEIYVKEEAPCSYPYIPSFGNHFLTSDSVLPETPIVSKPSTSTKSTMPTISLESRYLDVDKDDLKPPGVPGGKRLCNYCDFQHNSALALRKHKEALHTEKYKYRCFLCTRPETLSFPSLRFLGHHVAIHHRGERRWQCQMCWKIFKTKAGFQTHKKTMCRQVNPYACHLCDFTCKSLLTLERHTDGHNTETCTLCQEEVKKADMKKHIWYHHSPKQSSKTCEKCSFSTPSKSKMQKHYRQTNHNKIFCCETCNYATNSEEIYKQHFSNCVDVGDKFKCKIEGCGKQLKDQHAYQCHLAIHKFPHMKVHSCPVCDFETVYNGLLTKHLKQTKHHFKFKCPDCDQRFNVEGPLTRHIQRVHVEQIMNELCPKYESEDVAQTEDGSDETDPYAHFKKGWLGMSLEEEGGDMDLEGEKPDGSNGGENCAVVMPNEGVVLCTDGEGQDSAVLDDLIVPKPDPDLTDDGDLPIHTSDLQDNIRCDTLSHDIFVDNIDSSVETCEVTVKAEPYFHGDT